MSLASDYVKKLEDLQANAPTFDLGGMLTATVTDMGNAVIRTAKDNLVVFLAPEDMLKFKDWIQAAFGSDA